MHEPVERIAIDPKEYEPKGVALCLSGGGYRAMLFHAGAVWRLCEMGILNEIDRVSSVSGGSITAAVLGMNWDKLNPSNFERLVAKPLIDLAGHTLDVWAIITSFFLPGTGGDRLPRMLAKHVFGDRTLGCLPCKPEFVINSSNIQSGAIWRFSKYYVGDWRVGQLNNPCIPLSTAVAASCAFPPVLSPLCLKFDEEAYVDFSGYDLHAPEYMTDVRLSDGGVIDNLGLETAWKKHKDILVSDAGSDLPAVSRPSKRLLFHTPRIVQMIHNQVRRLRKRQLIASYDRKERAGAYWGIASNINNYGLEGVISFPLELAADLARQPTRLAKIRSAWRQMDRRKQLINWGYAVCDTAIRKHYQSGPPASALPYEEEQ